MTGLVDLHVHTTASDGSLTPAEVVAEAARLGLGAIAVTDHDGVGGLDEALAAGARLKVEVIPGVELSVNSPAPGYMHLLGLFIDHRHAELVEALARVAAGRSRRNLTILAKLNELGVDLTWEEVRAISADGQMGRPHLAQAMVNRGYVASLEEAMDRYLARGRPAYAHRYRLEAGEAIGLIHRAGGLAVCAHPASLGLYGPALKGLLLEFQAQGLDGVEVQCPSHDAAFRKEVAAYAASLGLLVSGGSDFHGRYKPKVRMGVGLGDLRVRQEVVEGLRKGRGFVRSA